MPQERADEQQRRRARLAALGDEEEPAAVGGVDERAAEERGDGQGTSCTRPTRPTAAAERVSAKTWTNTATSATWEPASETRSPSQSSR